MSGKTEPVIKKGSDPLNQVIIRPVSTAISSVLSRTPVTPNQVSVFALFLAVIAAVLIATRTGFYDRVFAAVLLYFYLVFDCVDGELARRKRVSSPYGKWLDGMVDTLSTSLLLFALAYASVSQSGLVAWLWGFAAVIGFNAANFSYQYGQLVFAPPKG
ncbi:MAG: CDP-alcohol phosphatidyltransferase family protein, partial [Candidatus Micrarchaeota archaeon]|nr:CDP-alcohol phosphatidyltransferase family protein [Candidatus Micrarchaeota archaeon]